VFSDVEPHGVVIHAHTAGQVAGTRPSSLMCLSPKACGPVARGLPHRWWVAASGRSEPAAIGKGSGP
jgi:hypothetical protein